MKAVAKLDLVSRREYSRTPLSRADISNLFLYHNQVGRGDGTPIHGFRWDAFSEDPLRGLPSKSAFCRDSTQAQVIPHQMCAEQKNKSNGVRVLVGEVTIIQTINTNCLFSLTGNHSVGSRERRFLSRGYRRHCARSKLRESGNLSTFLTSYTFD